jgi:hypothetical protein
MIELRQSILNGRRIDYSSETRFHVQVGKGKSAYRTLAIFTGNLAGAVIHFNGINLGPDFKKRLLMEGGKPSPVLARIHAP